VEERGNKVAIGSIVILAQLIFFFRGTVDQGNLFLSVGQESVNSGFDALINIGVVGILVDGGATKAAINVLFQLTFQERIAVHYHDKKNAKDGWANLIARACLYWCNENTARLREPCVITLSCK
jgi:hypothetical protein